MPQEITKKFWKTFDGKECSTKKEAEDWESANYKQVLCNQGGGFIDRAISLDPEVDFLTAAIERAAREIKSNRRKQTEAPAADAPPAVDPPPDPKTEQIS